MKIKARLSNMNKQHITITVLCLVSIIGGGFLYSRIAPYMIGPVVHLQETGVQTTTVPQITFSGTVVHSKQLSINGVPLVLDNNGNFNHEIVMQPGFNTYTLRADDSFGHSTIITKNYILQEQVYQSFARSESDQGSVIQ